MRHKFHTADVFTDRAFGGNQLAVFPDARGIAEARMQSIAREFNLSETVFVLPARKPEHTRRVRIFTPTAELPFAGHPTVGAAHVLVAIGEVAVQGETCRVIFEEGIGPVPVSVRLRGGQPIFAQLTAAKLPEIGPAPPSAAALAGALGLEPMDILETGATGPEAVSCGLPFLFVPVRNLSALKRIRVKRDRWDEVVAPYWAAQIFAFTTELDSAEAHVQARMFAPGLGVEEDPATGSAAAALAGYLGRRDPRTEGKLNWTIAQGVEMGRPSRLEIEADKSRGEITAVRVGGNSVMVTEGTMEVPD